MQTRIGEIETEGMVQGMMVMTLQIPVAGGMEEAGVGMVEERGGITRDQPEQEHKEHKEHDDEMIRNQKEDEEKNHDQEQGQENREKEVEVISMGIRVCQ